MVVYFGQNLVNHKLCLANNFFAVATDIITIHFPLFPIQVDKLFDSVNILMVDYIFESQDQFIEFDLATFIHHPTHQFFLFSDKLIHMFV